MAGAAITMVWAALVAVFARRVVGGEAQSMLELAESGTLGAGAQQAELSDVQRRLAATLEQRNEQIAALAEMVRRAPIADQPAAVVGSMASVARALTHDPTWVLAVLRGPEGGALPPGVYGPEPSANPAVVEDVHRWASTLQAQGEEAVLGARHATGPWGAFVVVVVAAGEELRAILMAPWEGRPAPSSAELGLLSLLGQHAATAIEHAVIYDRLRSQAEELNRMAAVQSDFLRGVTHDLQSPLTSIGALASELRDVVGDSPSVQSDLDIIAHQADRLRRMVGQLLVASRLEAGAFVPGQEVFRTEPIVRRTWAALRVDRPLEFAVEGPKHLAIGDPDRFEQVVWALLDNAVKYSPAGATVRVVVRGKADSNGPSSCNAEVEITDEGAGMDATTRDRAFEQFYRSADARRMAPDGSGVGLYAARGLMTAMGGSIGLDSRLGGGTTVRLTLPGELAEVIGDGAATQR